MFLELLYNISMSKKTGLLKIGKFTPSKVYKTKVDMSDDISEYFVNLGKEVITKDQYIEIGMIYALEKALDVKKKKVK